MDLTDLEVCLACKGEGVVYIGLSEEECRACEGFGISIRSQHSCIACEGKGKTGFILKAFCKQCQATGVVSENQYKCPTCHGLGRILASSFMNYLINEEQSCFTCNGNGYFSKPPIMCTVCKGHGNLFVLYNGDIALDRTNYDTSEYLVKLCKNCSGKR